MLITSTEETQAQTGDTSPVIWRSPGVTSTPKPAFSLEKPMFSLDTSHSLALALSLPLSSPSLSFSLPLSLYPPHLSPSPFLSPSFLTFLTFLTSLDFFNNKINYFALIGGHTQ